ncbi:MAG: DNA polymerase III subunit gamma/tau, partial [Clostridia bacterium]|nr:DNA polymerase III subunit gamma/tau [Clostridia bacterium]
MNYKALYRAYRPKTFDEVIGQKHIVSVLKNQVITGQISHAYLFTGSRGTGKTSIAKIFARAISCPNTKDGEACLECQLCRDTFNDTSIDVIELDAASNNGIDDIRELRENVKYAPVTGKYKVYIIDEVHALSGGSAYNALLKTLEEPPANVVFILATTDPQKLPDTIISRCQRYDFERIDKEDIADRLEYICKQEKVEADRNALLSIAEYVNGGLRDAISLLDQCIAFGEGNITKESVLDLLGRSDEVTLFKLCDCFIGLDGAEAIAILNEEMQSGHNPTVLAGDIVEHLHRLLIFKTAKNPKAIVDIADTKGYEVQAANASINMLIRGIKLFSSFIAD